MDESPPTVDADAPDRERGNPTPGGVRARSGYVPSRSDDVLELDLGDGIVLYMGDSTLVHHLNLGATIVWHLCDGRATVAELALEIAEAHSLDPLVTEDQVAEMIGELDTLGLVRDARSGDREEPRAAVEGRR